MIKFIKKAALSLKDQTRSFRERVFILMTLVSIMVGGMALIGDIILGENKIEIIALIGTIIIVPVVTFLAVKFDKISIASWTIVLGVVVILLPILFYFGGGLEGGGVIWIIFAYLYTGLILNRIWRPVMLVVITLETMGFYLHSYFHPEYIQPHTRAVFHVDSMLSIILVGFVCCFMVWFEEWLFKAENERAKEETRKVEELNRSQNRFFSSMSHEIRTPINSILGLNEIILRQEDASDEIIKDANNIQGASRMLLALINDILDFSKIEAGKMDIVPVNYSISNVLSEIVNMIWLRAEQKGLEFRIEVDPQVPAELYGDEVRIKQILVNLLNNAVKYTHDGSVTLQIEKEDQREDQVLLMFAVSDTGMGIKQDAIPYLFDAFQRVDEEKNTKIEGTGLGLSIVKQLVDLMDGKITVNSVYTQGSTFMVTLWQKVTRYDTVGNITITGTENVDRAGKYEAGFTAPEARILIVDDNQMNLEVEKKLLEDTKISIDTVLSGEEALALTASERYDVILMDHLMPQMDGIECMQNIRKQTGGLNNHVPVIVLTANAGSENRELYSSSGFDDYLVKPVSGASLEEMLLSHLPESKVIRNENADVSKYHMNSTGSYARKIPVLIAAGSICDLPVPVLKEQQIDVIPFSIHVDDMTYYDTYEAGTDELMRYMLSGRKLVSEPPSEEEFEKFFGRELKRAHDIIYIAGSSGLSAEYENAVQAAKAYGNVQVFDSGLTSACVGLMVLTAHKMSTQGRSPDKIIEELNRLKNAMHISFVADGAYYVQKKGQLDRLNDSLLKALSIHQYIGIKNGKFRIERFILGEKERSFERYVDIALHRLSKHDTDILIVVYVNLTMDELEAIRARIEKRGHFENILFQKASGTIALDLGPGSFGFIYLDEHDSAIKLSTMLVSDDSVTDDSDDFIETGMDNDDRTPKGYEATGDDPEDGGFIVNAGRYLNENDAGVRNETVDKKSDNKSDSPAWYENIPGIDAETAIQNSGSAELFETVLKIFYDSIGEMSDEIEDLYKQEDWHDYTIKVHALKSSARLIGAGELGEAAQGLEFAGKDNDIEYIRAHHDQVIADFREYSEYLKPVFEGRGEGDQEETGSSETDTAPSSDTTAAPSARSEESAAINEQFDRYLLESVYEALKDGATAKDDDTIDQILKEISEYPLPTKDTARIEEIRTCFEGREYDKIIALIDTMDQ